MAATTPTISLAFSGNIKTSSGLRAGMLGRKNIKCRAFDDFKCVLGYVRTRRYKEYKRIGFLSTPAKI